MEGPASPLAKFDIFCLNLLCAGDQVSSHEKMIDYMPVL